MKRYWKDVLSCRKAVYQKETVKNNKEEKKWHTASKMTFWQL